MDIDEIIEFCRQEAEQSSDEKTGKGYIQLASMLDELKKWRAWRETMEQRGCGLWEEYSRKGEMHIHQGTDPVQVAFYDALAMQYERIFDNLQKQYPEKSRLEIISMMTYGEDR